MLELQGTHKREKVNLTSLLSGVVKKYRFAVKAGLKLGKFGNDAEAIGTAVQCFKRQ